jgi:quinol monooxygenase YgiN
MIFIAAKFPVLLEHADRWLEIVDEFTRATRGEPGCLWFEWSRSVEDPTDTS